MSSKYMKIKRIVIPFISLVILTSQLTGCATLSSTEMLEELENGKEVTLEYSELNTEQEYEIIEETKNVYSESELRDIFKGTYESCTSVSSYAIDFPTKEAQIQKELEMIQLVHSPMAEGDKELPEDLEERYRDWRPDTPIQSSQPIQQAPVQQKEPEPVKSVQQQAPPQQSKPAPQQPKPQQSVQSTPQQNYTPEVQWDPSFGATPEEAAAGKGGSLIIDVEDAFMNNDPAMQPGNWGGSK